MRQFLIAIPFLLLACNDNTQSKQVPSVDTSQTFAQSNIADTSKNIWINKLNGRHYSLPDSIGGKPVSFYLDNAKVASIAKALYRGKFRPTDNDSTTKLLSYVTTDDSTVRPFYRWCLDFTIQISDGALAEYPGAPALKYAIKFPQEFFDYMDKDKSGQRYKQWSEIIAYSGLDNYGETADKIPNLIIVQMNSNCHSYNDSTKKRIDKFVKHVIGLVD